VFGWLRRKDERAIPEPGTPEFEAAVQGTAIPDSQSVSMGESGWTSPPDRDLEGERSTETIDLRGSGKRDEVEQVLREHGIDPDEKGQTVDASKVPGLQKALLTTLFGTGLPKGGGFGDGIPEPKRDPNN
jgi:hypothetical protein